MASIAPVNVETPAILTLSRLVCPSTSISTKSPSPTNVVAVIIPIYSALPVEPLNVIPIPLAGPNSRLPVAPAAYLKIAFCCPPT